MRAPRPLGLIRPLALGLGRAAPRWRGGPLVPMIWRRRAPARTELAASGSAPDLFAPTYVFNLSLAWPAGTGARVETLRTQLAAPMGRGPAARRPGGPAERLWSRLEKTVLSITHNRETATVAGGTAEAPPTPVPLLPRQPARARASIAAASPRSAPAPRAGAVRHWARQPAMRPVAEPHARGEAVAAPLSRVPAALVWRREDARAGTAGAWPALLGASARRGVELVWRRPPTGEAESETGGAREIFSPRVPAAPAAWRGEVQPAASRPAAPAAIPPVEMNRLVDEVVRRLDRIGRDERLRRGL